MGKHTIDRSLVPSLEWTWHIDQTTHGVHTSEGQLVWWERPDGPGGHWAEAATVQEFEEFWASGPPNLPIPTKIIDEIRTVLAEARG